MLSDYPAVATIPVTDMNRAKKWYAEKLGLAASMFAVAIPDSSQPVRMDTAK